MGNFKDVIDCAQIWAVLCDFGDIFGDSKMDLIANEPNLRITPKLLPIEYLIEYRNNKLNIVLNINLTNDIFFLVLEIIGSKVVIKFKN